jgi:hypothetical protein
MGLVKRSLPQHEKAIESIALEVEPLIQKGNTNDEKNERQCEFDDHLAALRCIARAVSAGSRSSG